jgi:phosphoribosyl 1,2-cyclic phosphodiesterase
MLTIRGARGTVPCSGPQVLRYGGHTTCVDVELAPDKRLVLDCGTGIRSLPCAAGTQLFVFLSHYHWDHIEGLPHLQALYDERCSFTFHGASWGGKGVQALLEEAFGPPWFPVGIEDTASTKTFRELGEGTIEVEGVRVTAAPLHHPQGVLGFRLEREGRSIAFATDHERGNPRADDALLLLADGVDVLIHDAQYTPDEYERNHRGWGHSTWRHAVEAAKESGARCLMLFHHDPARSDDALDAVVEQARREFPQTDAAREGMTLVL